MSGDELSMVYTRMANKKHSQATMMMIVYFFLKDFTNDDVLPQNIDNINCHCGEKTAACLLQDVMSVTNQAGIPVDRHLDTGFISLGWADPQEWEEKVVISQETVVEFWLTPDKWGGKCKTICTD